MIRPTADAFEILILSLSKDEDFASREGKRA